MRSSWRWFFALFVAGALGAPATIISQTPDEQTPAEEEACTKYEGEGARYGLCVAYCEAQDCEGTKLDPQSCANIEQNFIDWPKKKGYTAGKKPQPIDCKVTACTPEDRLLCGGVEQDCIVNLETKECESICTSRFEGTNDRGEPLCTKAPACKRCVADTPKP